MSKILTATMIACIASLQAAGPGAWSAPAEVRSDDNLCLTYQARLDGAYLVIHAKVEPGWHTFAMDNKQRAEEKLAGKKSLGIDQPTEFTLSGGLVAAGPWYQTSPKDFSKPQLRWFSWGYEGEATFAAKVRRTGSGPAKIAVRGQACTEVTCKNIDAAISLPISSAAGEPSDLNLKSLVPVTSSR